MRWLRRLAIGVALLALATLTLRWAFGHYGARRLAAARGALAERLGPLDLARLAPAAVPEEGNAALWILRAGAAIDTQRYREASQRVGRLLCCALGDWTVTEREEARQVLEEQAAAITLLPAIAAASGSDFGLPYADGWEVLAREMPDWTPVVQVSRLAGLEARAALDRGDLSRFLSATRALAATADALCSEPSLMTMIVGVSVERTYLGSVRDFLAAPRLRSATDLTVIVERTREGPCSDQSRRGIEGEAVLIGSAGDSWYPETGSPLRDWLTAPGGALVGAATLEGIDCLLENLNRPYSELLALQETDTCRPRRLGMIYQIAVPNMLRALGKARALETSRSLAVAALELGLERTDTGRFPESLELGPTPYTGEVPVYTRGDGWAEVAAPESEAFHRSRQASPTECRPAPPLFRFRVEVPTPAPAP